MSLISDRNDWRIEKRPPREQTLWDMLSPNEQRTFIVAIIIGALVLLALPSIGRLGEAAIAGLR